MDNNAVVIAAGGQALVVECLGYVLVRKNIALENTVNEAAAATGQSWLKQLGPDSPSEIRKALEELEQYLDNTGDDEVRLTTFVEDFFKKKFPEFEIVAYHRDKKGRPRTRKEDLDNWGVMDYKGGMPYDPKDFVEYVDKLIDTMPAEIAGSAKTRDEKLQILMKRNAGKFDKEAGGMFFKGIDWPYINKSIEGQNATTRDRKSTYGYSGAMPVHNDGRTIYIVFGLNKAGAGHSVDYTALPVVIDERDDVFRDAKPSDFPMGFLTWAYIVSRASTPQAKRFHSRQLEDFIRNTTSVKAMDISSASAIDEFLGKRLGKQDKGQHVEEETPAKRSKPGQDIGGMKKGKESKLEKLLNQYTMEELTATMNKITQDGKWDAALGNIAHAGNFKNFTNGYKLISIHNYTGEGEPHSTNIASKQGWYILWKKGERPFLYLHDANVPPDTRIKKAMPLHFPPSMMLHMLHVAHVGEDYEKEPTVDAKAPSGSDLPNHERLQLIDNAIGEIRKQQ